MSSQERPRHMAWQLGKQSQDLGRRPWTHPQWLPLPVLQPAGRMILLSSPPSAAQPEHRPPDFREKRLEQHRPPKAPWAGVVRLAARFPLSGPRRQAGAATLPAQRRPYPATPEQAARAPPATSTLLEAPGDPPLATPPTLRGAVQQGAVQGRRWNHQPPRCLRPFQPRRRERPETYRPAEAPQSLQLPTPRRLPCLTAPRRAPLRQGPPLQTSRVSQEEALPIPAPSAPKAPPPAGRPGGRLRRPPQSPGRRRSGPRGRRVSKAERSSEPAFCRTLLRFPPD